MNRRSGQCFRLLALIVAIAAVRVSVGQVSVTTFHNDSARTGQNVSEIVLAPGNVNVKSFGKLFTHSIQGNVYAQPLYVPHVSMSSGVHNVVYVATEHDMVYAFDADSNAGPNAAPLWSVSFISPDGMSVTTVPASDTGCPDLVPELGITGTPAIDTNTMTMYLVARTKESGTYKTWLHALDITTGADKFGSPVQIQASVPGTGDGSTTVSLNAFTQNQRAALVLSNGVVYIAFGSLCDTDPYHGWILAYQAQTLAQVGVWNDTPNGSGGGIWGGGSAPAVDANGNFFFATSNGTFNFSSGGTEISDSVIKLPPAPANGPWAPVDYFTPYNQASLAQFNLDLGSGGTVLFPDQPPSAPHQHLMTTIGKQGTIYLIDRDNLGHFNPVNNSQIVQVLPNALLGLMGIPAWWNNNVYFSGRNDVVKSYSFDPIAGTLSTAPITTSPAAYQYILGSSPSVSANGASNGILWTAENHKGTAIMHAYDASNLSNELFNTTMNGKRDGAGGGVRFMFPTIANGKVYLASNGKLGVYGLFTFVPGNLSFPIQNAGTTSAAKSVTLTNPSPSPMSITGISTSGEFGGLGGTCPISGGSLSPGNSCVISVAFMPQGGGILTGSINVAIAGANQPLQLPLSGTGRSVTASPTTLNLGTVPVFQTSSAKAVTVTILGSDPTSFGAISSSNPEFSIVSNTCVGIITGPSQCSVGIALTPTGGGARTGTLAINSSSPVVNVNLTGSGAALQFTPSPLAMGTVTIGNSSNSQFVTVNVLGSSASTFGASTLGGTNPGDFSIAADGCNGQTIAGGSSCSIGIVFTPTAVGNRYATLKVPNNDGPNPALLNINGVGRSAP